jgi:hypothetical protein
LGFSLKNPNQHNSLNLEIFKNQGERIFEKFKELPNTGIIVPNQYGRNAWRP